MSPLPDVDQPSSTLSDDERQILALWSEIHKKSTLTLFILLALARAPGWSGDIAAFLVSNSSGHLSIDEQSLYRALRRLEGLNVITHSPRQVAGTGAKRKVYELTESGDRILAAYLATTMSYLDAPEFVAAVEAARGTSVTRERVG